MLGLVSKLGSFQHLVRSRPKLIFSNRGSIFRTCTRPGELEELALFDSLHAEQISFYGSQDQAKQLIIRVVHRLGGRVIACRKTTCREGRPALQVAVSTRCGRLVYRRLCRQL